MRSWFVLIVTAQGPVCSLVSRMLGLYIWVLSHRYCMIQLCHIVDINTTGQRFGVSKAYFDFIFLLCLLRLHLFEMKL